MSIVRTAFGQIENVLGAEIIRSAKWQYFLNISLGVVGAAYMLVLGRLLGADAFGFYTLCVAVPTVVFSFGDARLHECVIYLFANLTDPEKRRQDTLAIYAFDAVMRTTTLAASVVVGLVIINLGYSKVDAHLIFLAAMTVYATKLFNTPSMGVLRARGELAYFSVLQVSDWTLRLASLGGLWFFGVLTIENVLLCQIAVGLLFNALIVGRAVILLGSVGIRELLWDFTRMVPVVRGNAALIFGSQGISVMDTVVKELDVLVCGLFLTVADVGIYKMAKNLSGIVWRLADPVHIVVLPRIAALFAGGEFTRLAAMTRHLTIGLVGASLGLFLSSFAAIHFLGVALVGPEFAQAIALYPLAAAWIVVALPLLWTHSMAIAAGRPVIQMWGGLLGNGIGLIALFVGAHSFGLAGAAIGLSLAYCLPFVFSFLLLRRAGVVGW